MFSTMLDRTVEFGEPSYTGPQPTANVVATVGFAGTLSGYVSLCVSHDAALEIAQALLGSDADEAPAHVRDAAGEMANMIAGSVRTAMADRGENARHQHADRDRGHRLLHRGAARRLPGRVPVQDGPAQPVRLPRAPGKGPQ